MPRRKAPAIPDELLDQLLAGADAKTAFDANGLLDNLKKALAERVLNAEMDHHLAGEDSSNGRNGYGRKAVTTASIRSSLPNISAAFPVSTTRSCRCMRGG
jgi:putative transposase